jgi:hypothetical protein
MRLLPCGAVAQCCIPAYPKETINIATRHSGAMLHYSLSGDTTSGYPLYFDCRYYNRLSAALPACRYYNCSTDLFGVTPTDHLLCSSRSGDTTTEYTLPVDTTTECPFSVDNTIDYPLYSACQYYNRLSALLNLGFLQSTICRDLLGPSILQRTCLCSLPVFLPSLQPTNRSAPRQRRHRFGARLQDRATIRSAAILQATIR